ncbi:hypothetical protein HYH03_007640 [Edaphochlamys debaryana]|uniref:Protein kinase domain-containing protein n=1 Tax=Edaphochlamys debaryana TaxID=47281 RepID=A0A835Y321_9CHLO|nr:hypothetical protein HYH03_007640 [Edaphochlamys debaryana]|eukprot:KAG2494287.1 hypothetical protein HYH03_007640 [Edaphochlamys debaryana]
MSALRLALLTRAVGAHALAGTRLESCAEDLQLATGAKLIGLLGAAARLVEGRAEASLLLVSLAAAGPAAACLPAGEQLPLPSQPGAQGRHGVCVLPPWQAPPALDNASASQPALLDASALSSTAWGQLLSALEDACPPGAAGQAGDTPTPGCSVLLLPLTFGTQLIGAMLLALPGEAAAAPTPGPGPGPPPLLHALLTQPGALEELGACVAECCLGPVLPAVSQVCSSAALLSSCSSVHLLSTALTAALAGPLSSELFVDFGVRLALLPHKDAARGILFEDAAAQGFRAEPDTSSMRTTTAAAKVLYALGAGGGSGQLEGRDALHLQQPSLTHLAADSLSRGSAASGSEAAAGVSAAGAAPDGAPRDFAFQPQPLPGASGPADTSAQQLLGAVAAISSEGVFAHCVSRSYGRAGSRSPLSGSASFGTRGKATMFALTNTLASSLLAQAATTPLHSARGSLRMASNSSAGLRSYLRANTGAPPSAAPSPIRSSSRLGLAVETSTVAITTRTLPGSALRLASAIVSNIPAYLQESLQISEDVVEILRRKAAGSFLTLAAAWPAAGAGRGRPSRSASHGVEPAAAPGSHAQEDRPPLLSPSSPAFVLYCTSPSPLPRSLLEAARDTAAELLRVLLPAAACALEDACSEEWGIMRLLTAGGGAGAGHALPPSPNSTMRRSSTTLPLSLDTRASSGGSRERGRAQAGTGNGGIQAAALEAGSPQGPSSRQAASPSARGVPSTHSGVFGMAGSAPSLPARHPSRLGVAMSRSVEPPLTSLMSAAAQLLPMAAAPRPIVMTTSVGLDPGTSLGPGPGGGTGPMTSSASSSQLAYLPAPTTSTTTMQTTTGVLTGGGTWAGPSDGGLMYFEATLSHQRYGTTELEDLMSATPHDAASGEGGGGAGTPADGGVTPLMSTVMEAAPSEAEARQAQLVLMLNSFKAELSSARLEAASPGGRHAGDDVRALQLVKAIGTGGCAVVLLATLHALPVAVKVMRPVEEEVEAEEEKAAAAVPSGAVASRGNRQARPRTASRQLRMRIMLRGARELAVMTSISHPNIVQVYSYCTRVLVPETPPAPGGMPRLIVVPEGEPAPSPLCTVLIMEYCDMGSLADAIDTGLFVRAAKMAALAWAQQPRSGSHAYAEGPSRTEGTQGFSNTLSARAIGGPQSAGGSRMQSLLPSALASASSGGPIMRAVYLTLLEVALALRHLHSMGLVHCDVKPANVLLRSSATDPRGFTAKLTDFGFVNLLEKPAGEVRQAFPGAEDEGIEAPTHSALRYDDRTGTVTHMAPELFLQGTQVDSSIDIYALGILMWEVFTCRAPYQEYAENGFQDVPFKVVKEGLRPRFGPGAAHSFTLLAQDCWATPPLQRPTAAAVVTRLEELLAACGEVQGGRATAAGAARRSGPAEQVGAQPAAGQ